MSRVLSGGEMVFVTPSRQAFMRNQALCLREEAWLTSARGKASWSVG